MSENPPYQIVESFTISMASPEGDINEYKLARFTAGDYGIIAGQSIRQPANGGEIIIPFKDHIIVYGDEQKVKKAFEDIKAGLLNHNKEMLQKFQTIKSVDLNDGDKIEAKIVNIRVALNNKTDLILKGNKTWVLRVPSEEAKSLNVGQQITLQKTQQGIRVEPQQISRKIDR